MRKEHYAFVFRQRIEVKEPNIWDIAKQRYFHAHPAESNLEYLISVRESVHATLVARPRTGNVVPEDNALIEEVVIQSLSRRDLWGDRAKI